MPSCTIGVEMILPSSPTLSNTLSLCRSYQFTEETQTVMWEERDAFLVHVSTDVDHVMDLLLFPLPPSLRAWALILVMSFHSADRRTQSL